MFTEVNRYLDLSYRHLNVEQKQEINQITPNDYQNLYAPLDTGSSGQTVDILGFPLRKYIPGTSGWKRLHDRIREVQR